MADKVEQLEMLYENQTAQTGPVTCLGMTFENDEARRAYFTEELRKKLPELRKIEGFPIGEDEDILALSDPPYYTACPNPFFNEIIKEWKSYSFIENNNYNREPFASDVTEGKTDPIYNAHSYHTKVPHKAIMRYILHYTNPGDIVFDGFCGTGMTGVAAHLCGNKLEVESLGYKVQNDGTILDEEGVPFSKLGERKAILNDLSPAATFIANNFNSPLDVSKFKTEAYRILKEIKNECEWMYRTNHNGQKNENTASSFGKINFTIWSDVVICSHCLNELILWDCAVNLEESKVYDEFYCSHCGAFLKKNQLEKAWLNKYDHDLGEYVRISKKVPVFINYTYNNKRYEKKPDEYDFAVIEKINDSTIPYWYPTNRMPVGSEARRNDKIGITHVHQFYTKRNLWLLASLWDKTKHNKLLRFALTSILIKTASLLHNIGIKKGKINLAGALPNSLYIPSNLAERNIIDLIEGKIDDIVKSGLEKIREQNLVYTMSFGLPGDKDEYTENLVDYIFVDPPFGSNLMYSELNFIWESWHKVFTNNEPEAIENRAQGKGLSEYHKLMSSNFAKAYRALKPGGWMTVEFSNTKASVWNVIQTSLQEAGFIVANVAALNKGQGTYNSQTNPTSVEQDLVISCYKPRDEFIKEMQEQQASKQSVWIFIKQHLEKLQIFKGKKGEAEVIIERTPRVLFDRMVAYYVQSGLSVPISSGEFQTEIAQRFPMRDGMVFLESQVAEYDKRRILAKEFTQLNLFVSDENSAIEWLRQQLLKKPQTRQDLHPNFMKEIQHIAKHEMLPELDVLLEQNFLMYDGEGEVPSQIHTYLSSDYKDLRNLPKNDPKLIEKAKNRWYVPDPNKQADLEKLREKSLLREFNQYVEELSNNKKKLKQFRTEAIRVGFYKAWTEKNYQIIVDIGNRLPESILQEDEKLLRYYDNAQTKLGL
ncbi:DNA methyltransferase [Paenibacillus thermoaerophilus]|uniref:DNA methyltransferase n=1 Tax=Paenibacillus thermoaerophilus TaxID=1215385 RepID=A0ABW2V220_9BACL|nr:DNA methyltransferase [Paenibacillus thermoaerophilus]TMV13962.1 site-specific DNA-methyltransferase [Paenibacillus thermoaerophilus]